MRTLPFPHLLTTPYGFSAAWDDLHKPPEVSALPEKLKTASPKKRAEFFAGRFCAAKAIRALDPEYSGEVGMNSDGSPRWPDGLVGSITHTKGYAAAAIAPRQEWLGIGIDSEKMRASEALQGVRQIALNEDERRLGASLPIPEGHFILLVFSAKESIYKSLYPLVKHPIEFSDVHLTEIDFETHTFYFQLLKSNLLEATKSARALGGFEFSHDCIHTGVEWRLL